MVKPIFWDVEFLYECGKRVVETRKLYKVLIMSDNLKPGLVYKSGGEVHPLLENSHVTHFSRSWITIEGHEQVSRDACSYKQVIAIRPSAC